MNIVFPEYIIIISSILWLTSFIGFIISYNFIILLISFEMMFLSICTILCIYSFIFKDVEGQIFSLFVLGIVAVESALALSLYVVIFINNR